MGSNFKYIKNTKFMVLNSFGASDGNRTHVSALARPRTSRCTTPALVPRIYNIIFNDEQYESILKVMNSRDENNRRDAMYDSRNFRKQERNVRKEKRKKELLTKKIIALVSAALIFVGVASVKKSVDKSEDNKSIISEMIENKEYTEKIRAMREINKKIGSLVSDNDELSSIFSQCVVQNGVDDVRFLHEQMAKKIMELDPELQTYALCGVLNSMDNYRDTKFGHGEYTNGDYLIHLLDNVDADKLDEFLSHVNKDGSQEFDEFLMSQLEQNDYINTVVDSLIAEKNESIGVSSGRN